MVSLSMSLNSPWDGKCFSLGLLGRGRRSAYVLLHSRCFTWGSIDCTGTHHLPRRCGVRPTVLTYLWSSEATISPAET